MSATKATPAELRKAAAMSDVLIKAGIDFVPVIVESENHKQRLLGELGYKLDQMEKEAV